MLEAHPDALGVSSDAIADRRVRVADNERGEIQDAAATAFAVGEPAETRFGPAVRMRRTRVPPLA
jgi:hypothetical protein